MPEEQKFTVNKKSGKTISLSFYHVGKVTAEDLVNAIKEHFPDKKLSEIYILPCMTGVVTPDPKL